MPTYQYACTSCGEELEAVQKFSDEPLTECPACGGRLRKVFSAVGVVFKGSGFYKTDSRTTSKASSSAGKSDSAGGSSGDSSTTSNEKPATSDKSSADKSSADSSSGAGKSTTASSSSGQVA